MAIRLGLLALLDEGPAYGYQLKATFEERTGGTWPLNIGQGSTTLARAERDGLVAQLEVGDDGRVVYEITDAGRHEVGDWFASPVRRDAPARDELTIKLAVAVTAPWVDVASIVQTQRSGTMRTLHALTRLKIDAAPTPTRPGTSCSSGSSSTPRPGGSTTSRRACCAPRPRRTRRRRGTPHRDRSRGTGERTMTSPVLELDDVTGMHGSGATAVHALRGVSRAVEAGELVAVMGPSGSAMSTRTSCAGGWWPSGPGRDPPGHGRGRLAHHPQPHRADPRRD